VTPCAPINPSPPPPPPPLCVPAVPLPPCAAAHAASRSANAAQSAVTDRIRRESGWTKTSDDRREKANMEDTPIEKAIAKRVNEQFVKHSSPWRKRQRMGLKSV
jgi:hypothetical protein